MLSKGDIGNVLEPREPNECIQLDFWGPISYLKEQNKLCSVAVDRFSRWQSVMVTTTKTSNRFLKFWKSKSTTSGYLVKPMWTKGHASCPTSLKTSVIANELSFYTPQ